jgi:hypothetical protein
MVSWNNRHTAHSRHTTPLTRPGALWRRYFDLHRDQRKLYGAVAAAIIPENVLDFALKQGFYVIRQSGDNVSIVEPQDRPKAW